MQVESRLQILHHLSLVECVSAAICRRAQELHQHHGQHPRMRTSEQTSVPIAGVYRQEVVKLNVFIFLFALIVETS